MKRIGIFSGTFDPIHDGHVALALAAHEELRLDSVVLLVEDQPWRKIDVTDVTHRLVMAQQATEDYGFIEVLSGEKLDVGRTHTVHETMQALKAYYPPGATFVLLMGGDVFEHLERWNGYEELIHDASFAVGLRSEDDGELLLPLAERLGAKATFLATDQATIASTPLRSVLGEGQPPKNLNPKVVAYAQEHGLYC